MGVQLHFAVGRQHRPHLLVVRRLPRSLTWPVRSSSAQVAR